MNPMIFPKMLVSDHEGWDWLLRVHPSVTRMFLFWVMPMSLIPPAMLVYTVDAYASAGLPVLSGNELAGAAACLYLMQLLAVPLMAAAVRRIGSVIDAHPEYRDAFIFAAVVPTPLWLAPLALFVPSLLVNALVVMLAMIGCAMMIFEGVYRVFRIDEGGHALLVAGTILAAGMIAWVGMLGMLFVGLGVIVG